MPCAPLSHFHFPLPQISVETIHKSTSQIINKTYFFTNLLILFTTITESGEHVKFVGHVVSLGQCLVYNWNLMLARPFLWWTRSMSVYKPHPNLFPLVFNTYVFSRIMLTEICSPSAPLSYSYFKTKLSYYYLFL